MAIIRKIEPVLPRITVRKRVAAYARVSTGLEQQLNSDIVNISLHFFLKDV